MASSPTASSHVQIRQDPRLLASNLFASLQCKDLIGNQKPVFVPASATVQDACSILIKNHIQAAPVQSKVDSASFAGIFTLRSLCRFVVEHFSNPVWRRRSKSAYILILSDFDLRRMVIASVGPRTPALEYSKLDDFVRCLPADNVSTVTSHFRQGIRRVISVNSKGEFVGAVTQKKNSTAFP